LSINGLAKFTASPKYSFQLNYQTPHRSFASNVKLESLGDSISTAVVVEWKKNAGDQVNIDDVVAVVETDKVRINNIHVHNYFCKVTMDIRAKEAGVFVKAFGDKGAEVTVGSDFYSLDAAASPSVAPSTSAPPAEAAASTSEEKKPTGPGKQVQVPVPQMGESISQGVLAKWNVEIGSSVNAGDALASVETDKVRKICHASNMTPVR
jgi:pyruvate/2-oxoglutarate dehydrogenase complex dihydrolipoamide acyltransferase (E2) component